MNRTNLTIDDVRTVIAVVTMATKLGRIAPRFVPDGQGRGRESLCCRGYGDESARARCRNPPGCSSIRYFRALP